MMKKIKSVRELKNIASSYDQGFIFRGQTKHHLTNDGKPSITTSFFRNGCIPHLMQKWDFYCREALLALKGPDWDGGIELDECQAILQHYGWRSFFIDFSSDFSVAAWFGAHAYADNFEKKIVEDCQEVGLMAIYRIAQYQRRHNDYGYIYIVSREALLKLNVSSFEMIRFRFSDFDSRIDRQKAVMVYPRTILPEEAIVEILEVPVEILAEFSSGLTQAHLFPDRSQDLIYKLLLASHFEVPKHIEPIGGAFGPYVRSLDIPEYDYQFKKFIDSKVAFYQPRYLLEPDTDASKVGVIVRGFDSFLYHTEVDLSDNIDGVMSLMNTSSRLTIETDGMIKLPTYADSTAYLKGAFIEKVSDGLIIISGFVVDHPGTTCTGFGADMGWHYRLEGGKIRREPSDSDCPCNNSRKHILEATIVKKLQHAITQNLIKYENGSYIVLEE